ncbi:MAG: aspartate kinase [bacterium]
MIIMKFGGSSIASGERIKNVAGLIQTEKRSKVVVVSALGGVTDSLIEIAETILGQSVDVIEQKVEKYCDWLTRKHLEAIEIAIHNKKIAKTVSHEVTKLIGRLRVALLGVGYLEDLSLKSMDYILAFGERLSMNIMSGALRTIGIESRAFTGAEAGILTDSAYGKARPLLNELRTRVHGNLKPLIESGSTPVVSGFIGSNKQGHITTLGRGGSDYTASLLGVALDNVEEVQIWTDVDGIMTTDPKIVKQAKLIKKLSYVEALDLSYFGAKVIHSKMIEPAMMNDVPVRVKNTFNPGNDGTLIMRKQEKADGVIKAVALVLDVVIVTLSGVAMAETPNVAGRVFSVLGEANINVIMISGSSDSNLSFVVSSKDAENAVDLLAQKVKSDIVEGLSLIRDVAIVCVVGSGMIGTKGVAAKIFSSIYEADVNIIMIAQGSSEVNIAFIVLARDAEKVVKVLHKKFIS